MEIFRPPLEAPTAYLDGSSPRPIKALPLEFGFFLGTLWGRKNKPEYEAARRDKYDRDWMHNFEPTPLVVLLHPIDKSYWVLFNYLPGKKRSGPWTKNLSDTHHNTHSDNCDLCEMCCERCYEPTDLWTHETWRGYRYEEQVRELWRVEPIERLEDSDFWERAGITPFSVLRIPPLGDDDDSSEDDSCPKWIFDEELVETEPEKEEEQSSRDHGPFIEVVQSNCEEATAYKMFSEATNVRPNPFKAKHAEWKEYWDKYVSVPAPGASPSSAANQEGQDQGPGPSEQPVVEEWRCASCPKCRLRNQPTGNEEDNEDEETERWPEPEREMMHMPRVRLNPGKRRRRPRVKPGRGGTSAKVEVEAEPEPASASSPEPQRPSSTGGSGQQEGT
ncbi:hypothetical protein A1O3_01448 [Capronia epimyces CBS 606.96]|uniref:Uncharacterized protein n=1 Tax=Capronia epimyces CBS 606.96 TaxID=1182542 RepID=W9ZEI3_9EURO|nr:uncharacterized protein A1O3_01448 [Capronia epimyces CBS 606.96]EXJ92894.1 hypothetical protein A1O3_01448 [Capronia epimyces CBS 606.96]